MLPYRVADPGCRVNMHVNITKQAIFSTHRAVTLVLCCFAAGMIVLLIRTAWIRAFDPDEFQHLQIIWLIARGEIPYKDFFEHHTPFYHFLLSPLLSHSASVTNGDTAVRIIREFRIIGVATSTCILVLTYFITSKLAGRLAAAFACALLVSSVLFIRKAIEIRPDQLATLLLLISTLALIYAKESEKWRWFLALSGATAALGILATQKVLIAAPGLATTLFVALVQRRMTIRSIGEAICIFAGAGTIVLFVFLCYFWLHGALNDFITDNFLLGLKWLNEPQLRYILLEICREDPLFLFVAGIGLLECLRQKRDVTIWWLAILAPFFFMALLAPIFPVVQAQYFFLILPYAAIIGGIGSACIARTLCRA